MPKAYGRIIWTSITVLVAGILCMTSTGAVVLDGPADPLSDEVALQPGDNPYTYIDRNGEFVIDITEDNPRLDADGVNANALTVEDEFFYIVYNGSKPAELWIEHDLQPVTFVVNGESIENSEEPLVFTSKDKRTAVGVVIDTRTADVVPGDRLTDEITVQAQPANPEPVTQDGVDRDSSGSGNGNNMGETDTSRVGNHRDDTSDKTGEDGTSDDSSEPGTITQTVTSKAGTGSGPDDPTGTPVQLTEVNYFDLADIAGLIALVAVVAATLRLIRRAPH